METTPTIHSSFRHVTLKKHGCNVIVSTWANDHIQITYNHRNVEVEWTKVNGVVTIKMYGGLLAWLKGQAIIHIDIPKGVDVYWV